jgi:hypothetical protein
MSVEDDNLKATIIAVLGGAEMKAVRPFTIKGQLIAYNHYSLVATHIQKGDIKIKHFPDEPETAYYEPGTDTFYVDGNGVIDCHRKALIVHEATHAINDIAFINMDIATSEALSYVAQAQYMRANSGKGSTRQLHGDTDEQDKVFELAWSIATTLAINKTPSEAEYDALRAAINLAPKYLGTGADPTNFNGVNYTPIKIISARRVYMPSKTGKAKPKKK